MKQFNIHLITYRTSVAMILLCLTLKLTAQTNSDGSSPQYLFRDFVKGTVKMKNGSDQSLVMNYNTVTEKMVFDQNGKLMDMTNLDRIDTVFLQDCMFVPVEKVFHEVLLKAPISLYIQNKGEIMPPGKPAAYGGTSELSSTNYMKSVEFQNIYYNLELPKDFTVKSKSVYWIRKNNEMSSFITEKQFLKQFPEKADELKEFIKQNRIKFDKQDNLKKLVGYCNEIIK